MPPPTEYAPEPDGQPDPGEVVWTWVAYEDDPSQGKDRPVLVLARERGELLCLQLTSKDHDRDAAQEASWGRHWTDVGSGGWDRERRPSEVRLDRLLRVRERDVRREGAALDREVFERVVREAGAFSPELRAGAPEERSGRRSPGRRGVPGRRSASGRSSRSSSERSAGPALDRAEIGRRAVQVLGALLRRR